MRPRPIAPALLALALAAASAAPPSAGTDPDGIRRRPARRFDCGTVPDLPERMARRDAAARRLALAMPESGGSVDLGQIAVLFDAGNLVVSGFTNTTAIAQQFYATHADDFDYLAIFISTAYNTDVQIESGFAFHRRVRNDVSGLGLPLVDNAPALGLPTARLKSILQLNDLLEYQPRFDDPLPQFGGQVEGVEVLGQEAGHQFASFAEVPDEGMLGRDLAHWSFFMDSGASVMEGNRWQADGTGWLSVEAFEHYSHLDQYLMGLRDAAAVAEPIYVLQRPRDTGGRIASSPPEVGVRIRASRRDIAMSELIGSVGARVPDAALAPKRFRVAFALVVPQGATPPPGDLDRLESYRRAWVDWFALETDGLGAIDTALPGVPVAADFETEIFAGPAPLAVAFRDRSLGPVTGWLWEFGDGETSTERDPIHLYAAPGFFTVRLTVSGPGGPAVRTAPFRALAQPFVEAAREEFESNGAGWAPGAPSTALGGLWIQDDPVGTSLNGIVAQPEDDATPGEGVRCFVTGNTVPGGAAGANDVDGGTTTFESPSFDLTGLQLPVIEYAYWLSNDLGGEPGGDSLRLEVSADGGASWLPLDAVRRGDRAWRRRQVRLTEAIAPGAQVRFRFLASDLGFASLVEAAVDDFRILGLYGHPDGDGDAIPDSLDNCAAAANPPQIDGDLDGFGQACDCDDADPAKGPPPSAGILIAADPADPARFTWEADPVAASYNVYRGQVPAGTPFAYNQACFEKHSSDTATIDPSTPPSRGWSFYLAAPENACGEAGLGTDSSGAERPFAVHCPPPIQPGG